MQQPAGNSAKEDWFALLDHYGYYDQSYLVHDFARFLQQSPTNVSGQLLEKESSICCTRTELL